MQKETKYARPEGCSRESGNKPPYVLVLFHSFRQLYICLSGKIFNLELVCSNCKVIFRVSRKMTYLTLKNSRACRFIFLWLLASTKVLLYNMKCIYSGNDGYIKIAHCPLSAYLPKEKRQKI